MGRGGGSGSANPRQVSRMLISRSAPHPATMNAPAGGKRMVMKTMIIAEAAPIVSALY